MKKVLFVQSQESWVNNLKKSFNGNYHKTAEFDFRRTPASAIGRLIWGLKYDIFLLDYGWSIDGLKKQIMELSPNSQIYTYSQMQCLPINCHGPQLIKKDINSFAKILESSGIVTNDKHK